MRETTGFTSDKQGLNANLAMIGVSSLSPSNREKALTNDIEESVYRGNIIYFDLCIRLRVRGGSIGLYLVQHVMRARTEMSQSRFE